MRVLGIDPGTIVTGYGLIDEKNGRLSHVDNGGIFPPPKKNLPDRIFCIHEKVEWLIQKFSPDAIAIEEIFVAKNVASTLKLGHARGAAMIAGSRAQIPIFEYSANQVKKALTGYGHASKEQIQRMVRSLLKLPGEAFSDASDALAVAICHSSSYRMLKKVGT